MTVLRRPVSAAAFGWETSRNPVLVRARRVWDGELPRRVTRVPLRGRTGACLVYAGLRHGETYVVPFLARQLGAPYGPWAGAGTPAPRRSAGWAEVVRGDAFGGAELAVVGCTERRARELGGDAAVLLPYRVHLVVPVGPDPEAVLRRVSRKDRQQFTRDRRRRDWRLERADGAADFAEFYDRYHLPTMRSRHGAAARSVARGTAQRTILPRGALFFAVEGGRRAAGMLCLVDRGAGRLTLRLTGVRDGAAEHYRSGAYTALYVMLLQWAGAAGLQQVDLSGCEPFLSKGILQFKRKLHPEVTLPRNHFGGERLRLQARADTPAVRDFLAANPMLACAPGGGLEALYFHDAERPLRTDLAWRGMGLVGARALDLDQFLHAPRLRQATGRRPSASAS